MPDQRRRSPESRADPAASPADPWVRDHPPAHRYEIIVDGQLAGVAIYERRPGRVVFVHTEIRPEFKGRGLADRLARWALDDVRQRRDEKVIARCPFIAGFIGRHAEYGDLLAGRPPAVPPPPVTRD
jgi:predicted GNAT family acetyltransferase